MLRPQDGGDVRLEQAGVSGRRGRLLLVREVYHRVLVAVRHPSWSTNSVALVSKTKPIKTLCDLVSLIFRLWSRQLLLLLRW